MITLRRYRDGVQAACAAEALRAAGIPAEIIGENSFYVLPVAAYGFASLHLVIPSDSLRARAEEILATLTDESHPLESLPEPDLSRLAPNHRVVPCPACAKPLAINPALHRCASCASPIDPVALIADTFGPEALAPCYLDADAPAGACPSCAAPIPANTRAGRCPTCGALFEQLAPPRGDKP